MTHTRRLFLCFDFGKPLRLWGSQSTGPNIPTGASEGIADTHALILESTYGGSPLKSAKDLEQYKIVSRRLMKPSER